MNYTKETKLTNIPNCANILEDTLKSVKEIYETYTIGDFINVAKDSGDESLASTTLGIFCGEGSSAISNMVKKEKGTLCEKLSSMLSTWRKNSKGGGKITQAIQDTKLQMAENMARANMQPQQIATISGLSLDVVNTIFAKIKAENTAK